MFITLTTAEDKTTILVNIFRLDMVIDWHEKSGEANSKIVLGTHTEYVIETYDEIERKSYQVKE
jgi:hypothetical protein